MGRPKLRLADIIVDSSLLRDVFGRWPPFHDAEVLRLRLDRGAESGPTLQLDVRVFDVTGEVDEQGCYALRHDTEVTLEFGAARLAHFDGFNEQNVIDDPICEALGRDEGMGCSYRITIPGLYGVSLVVDCASIRVLAAKPFVD